MDDDPLPSMSAVAGGHRHDFSPMVVSPGSGPAGGFSLPTHLPISPLQPFSASPAASAMHYESSGYGGHMSGRPR
jgi:hypothetical protein